MALSKDPKSRAKQLANRRDAPPAERGNKRAMTHGGNATPEPRRQAALERQVCDALTVRDRDGGPPIHDLVTVRLLAITLARLESVARYISKNGQFTRSGRVAPAVDVEEKLIARASNLADKLGMSPVSRAKMSLDLVQGQVSLATLMSDAADDTPTRTPPRPDDIEGSATDA